MIAKQRLYDMAEKDFIPAFVNFSAQTNSFRTQEMIENKLEKKRKTILGTFYFLIFPLIFLALNILNCRLLFVQQQIVVI